MRSKYYSDELDTGTRQQRRAGKVTSKKALKGKHSDHAVRDQIAQHSSAMDATEVFQPTLTASRHERDWILNYLGEFYEEEKITDVLRRVKGGKEANVYCCSAHPQTGFELVAAKLYRPRMLRNLRNDARYRQGRKILDQYGKEVRDGRYLKAVEKGTDIGKELTHTSWLEHEYQTMELLYDAGVPLPKPLARGHNTILMEYIGELDQPAPTLNSVTLEQSEAEQVFAELIAAVEAMLAHGRVHADLSAYNVLYWQGQPYIIDFPQAVNPAENWDAFEIFQRDIERLCQYFARYLRRINPRQLASDMWRRSQGLTGMEVLLEEEIFAQLNRQPAEE